MLFSTIWVDPRVNAGYLSVPIRNLAGPEMFLTFVSSNTVYINFIFELIILISLLFLIKVSNSMPQY